MPELGEGMMRALSASWKRARLAENLSVRGGDLVLELVSKYRLEGDRAPASGDLASRLSGKDFDEFVPDADHIPSDPRIAREVSEALREAAWMAQPRKDVTVRDPGMWAPDVGTLLCLAFVNASGVNDSVLSWHHCMNIVFAVGMLTPRDRTDGGDPHSSTAAPARPHPWVPFADMAKLLGVVESKAPGAVTGAVSGTARLARRELRRFGPVAYLLQWESIRQAVRNGDGTVMPAHVLMAVVSAAHQLRQVDGAVAPRFAPTLQAGFSLLDRGVDANHLKELTAVAPESKAAPAYSGKYWQRRPKDPAVGGPAFKVFEDAAVRDRRRHVGDRDLVSAIASSEDPVTLSILEVVDLGL